MAKAKKVELSPLDEFRAFASPMKYDQLAELAVDLQNQKDELKKRTSWLQSQLDVILKEVIPDKMAEDGFRSVNLADGGRWQLSKQAYCSTREGQKQALFNWLYENGFPELISEVVNPSTLKAFITEQMEMGNPIPDEEIINYQPYIIASIVGMKGR